MGFPESLRDIPSRWLGIYGLILQHPPSPSLEPRCHAHPRHQCPGGSMDTWTCFPVSSPSVSVFQLSPIRFSRELPAEAGVVNSRRCPVQEGRARSAASGGPSACGMWTECAGLRSHCEALSSPSRRHHLHAPNSIRGVMPIESETHDGGREDWQMLRVCSVCFPGVAASPVVD